MFLNITKMFIFFGISFSYSFTPHVPVPPLGGKISNDLTLLPVSRSMAYSKMKEYQMRSIFRNDPMNICSELNDAREMMRSPNGENDFVSFLISNRDREHLYTILYRVTGGKYRVEKYLEEQFLST